MKAFVQWHKDRIKCASDYFGLSHYQLLWIAGVKGVIIGLILAEHIQ